ncbi:hypothetical protein L7F22_018421 [Adiantum nelumboides]|nr:hypothetical protein [Adiantum nelumboides]
MEPTVMVCAAMTSAHKLYIAVYAVIWLTAFASVEAFTDSQDVYALNDLYNSLSSPFLNGWNGVGGDPCAENWEGVACAGPNVTFLNMTGLGLTGGLGSALQNLTALIVLDLSNNLLSGGLPLQLPPHVQVMDLSINQFTGNLPLALSELSNLVSLNMSNNLFSGNLLDMFTPLEGLSSLDLSSNGFDGPLPPSFAALTSLNHLYVQDNNLSGSVDVLATLPLTDLNLSNNSFSGWIPADLKKFPPSIFTGNSFNTFPAPPPPPPLSVPPTPPPGPKSHSVAQKSHSSQQTQSIGSYLTVGRLIGIGVASLLVVAVAVLVICFFVSRKRSRDTNDKYDSERLGHGTLIPPSVFKVTRDQKQSYFRAQLQKEELDELEPAVKAPPKPYNIPEMTALKPPPVPFEILKPEKNKKLTKEVPAIGGKNVVPTHAYTIADLQLATQSFTEENLIGDGTLGKVYKGLLRNGQVVAIKKLDYSITRMGQEDFLEFLVKISRFRHENIVELVGYCIEHGEHLLVYNFVGNGSVHENLHSDLEMRKRLSWKSRVKIALGTARALEYLHETCKPPIFHRNLTSKNILLDDNLTPYLSDCGLSNYFQHEQASAERLGYSPPEHTSSGIYTTESDIYSFGVVMLELLTGCKALDSSRPRSEQSLVRWAIPQLCDIAALAKMLDSSIKGTYSKKSVSRFADVISQCVQTDPKFRPSMGEVVQCLEQVQEM